MMTKGTSAFYAPILRAVLRGFGYFYPFYSGGGKFSKLLLFKSVAPSQPCLVHLKNGRKLWLNPSEYIGRTVYYFRDFDRKVTFFCRRLLEKDDIFLDIGANIGTVFLNCADVLNLEQRGQIHAFEPNPEMVEYLHKTLVNNSDIQINNIFIHPVGLSDKDGTAQLNILSKNLGCASISRYDQGKKVAIEIKDSLPVFQKILGNNKNSYVIKIDVEGHEPVILNRVKNFLRSRKPKAIIFEFNEFCKNGEEPEIFSLLRQMGMVIFSIRRGAIVRPYLELLPERFERSSNTDYVAVDEAKVNWLSKRVRIRS